MTRFIRQPNSYSCGPTAILNSAKWCGLSFTTQKHLKVITALCETSTDTGTEEPQFERTLRAVTRGFLRVNRRDCPTLAGIKSYLNREDRALVFLYWRKGHGFNRRRRDLVDGHYTLVLPSSDKSVVCVNDSRTKTLITISYVELKKRLRFMNNGSAEAPRVWFLQKRKVK